MFVILLLSLPACETIVDPYGRPVSAPLTLPGGGVSDGGAFSLITPQQEIELGEQVAAEVESQQRLHPDPQLQAYVQGIGHRLAANSSRQDVPYSFVVIDNPDSLNAFALPGGRTYVYTGMMKLASNEAELAAVMAHEIAHVALRHHASTITRQYGFEMLTGIILGQNPDERSRLVADLIGTGVQARYSRDQERESDELGMQLLANAGYNPEAMLTIFDKMRVAGRDQPNLPIFASHPTTDERLQRLQALLQTVPVNVRSEEFLFTERYQQEALSKI